MERKAVKMTNPEIRLVVRIDIFISSPGDLGEEREIVKRVIEKLNRGSLKDRYFFVPLLYEEEVPPEIGADAQLIVDRYMQVQSSYIMVSMFWTRMGTPFTILGTNERYESGTQYEFLKGYEHYREADHPHILLYRKQKENPEADPEQKLRVEQFFESFIGDPPRLKGLFARYTEPGELEEKIEGHIVKVIETYPPQPESDDWMEPPEFKEEPRRIDAAMPQETAVGQSTPVQVMICLPDSKGLEAFLPLKADKDEIRKKDVRKGGLTIAFPVDKKTGKTGPVPVKVTLETDDFKITDHSVNVQLAAGSDSGQLSFQAIPLKPSRRSMIIVKVKSRALNGGEVECGSVILAAKVKAAKDQAIIPAAWNLVSRSLTVASASAGRPQRVKKARRIDQPTIRVGCSSAGLMAVEGIGPAYVTKLKMAGVRSTQSLLEMGKTPAERKSLAVNSGLGESNILAWVNRADMFRIKGIGEEYASLLEDAGVDTIAELSKRNAHNLLDLMMKVNAEKNLVNKLPSLSQVERWVAQARMLPRIVTY